MLLHLIISILVASVLVLDLFLEISNGDVFIYWNNVMCFENMVLWQDIVTGEGAKVHDSHLKILTIELENVRKILVFIHIFLLF